MNSSATENSKPHCVWFRKIKNIIILFWCFTLINACGIMHPNRILDTDKKFQSQTFLDTIPQDFKLKHGDVIELYVYPKKGYILIESQITTNLNTLNPQVIRNSMPYNIDQNGLTNLPIIGQVELSDLTEQEAEIKLTKLYSEFYIDPFVNVLITNKFITVYRGGSDAKQLNITRPDITILDAIAQAGGIPENARSSRIKVLRMVNGVTLMEEIDLSGIDDIKKAESYIKPNDIIYIEPGINAHFFREVSPIITTVSSIVVIYAFFANLNK